MAAQYFPRAEHIGIADETPIVRRFGRPLGLLRRSPPGAAGMCSDVIDLLVAVAPPKLDGGL